MSYKTFRMLQGFMGLIIGAVLGASIALGNWIIPIFTVIIGLTVMTVLRRRVKDIVADERTYAIAEKAARFTVQAVAIGMAATGAVMLALSQDSSEPLAQVAIALEYATCTLLVVNYFAYMYYSRKLGGR
jgi:uncharacterized membrane protein